MIQFSLCYEKFLASLAEEACKNNVDLETIEGTFVKITEMEEHWTERVRNFFYISAFPAVLELLETYGWRIELSEEGFFESAVPPTLN